MARKITERERLLTYAMSADKDQLEEALETFRVALSTRFAQKKERKKKEAKPAPQIDASIPEMIQTRKGPIPKFVPDPDMKRIIDEAKAEKATG